MTDLAGQPAAERVAWYHPFCGIAGDMALGAALDAGADLDAVISALESLPVTGWELRAESVLRGGVACTWVHVEADDLAPSRTAGEIIDLVVRAGLDDRTTERATSVFRRLAAAEGHLHRRAPGDVHLHEVGGIDAIVDIVGTCAALESLGVDTVAAGPVATGVGTVVAAHGELPVPAPAVLELLRGAPTRRVPEAMELTTPTGAAILAALATEWGAMPAMTILSAGYGAGTRELDGRVNAVQLVIGERARRQLADGDGQPLVELAANVDDITGEALSHAIEALLDAGALDAWVTPALMKKGRPGHIVSVLAEQSSAPVLAETLIAETGSFGVRSRPVERWAAARDFDAVDVDGHPVRIKVSPARTKVEHDDAAAVARRTGRPLREVVSLAEEAARRRHRDRHPADPDFDPDRDPGFDPDDEPA